MKDSIVIGAGPAGLSAAITLRQRNADVSLISNPLSTNPLYKAHEVNNYPGLPKITGKHLLLHMTEHAKSSGAELIQARVTNIVKLGNAFTVGYGSDILQARTVILSPGLVRSAVFPGESELLGRGVSYCATCDGMLYRGKRVVVVALSRDSEGESEFLKSIGCEVVTLKTKNVEIHGTTHVESVTADGVAYKCSGVFVLRETIAASSLLPGLDTANGHITTDRAMHTNIPGIFAAGDCTGTPYQISKAAGEGLIAALSASEYLQSL